MEWFPVLFGEKLPAWCLEVMLPVAVIVFMWVAVIALVAQIMILVIQRRYAVHDFNDLPDDVKLPMAGLLMAVLVLDTILAAAAAWLQAGWLMAIAVVACIAGAMMLMWRLADC